MSAESKAEPKLSPIEAATDQAIILSGGDVRAALQTMIRINNYLERENEQLKVSVSRGYARGALQLPPDRKDWFD